MRPSVCFAAVPLPAVGSAERAQFYKRLVWLTHTLQAPLICYFYPDRLVRAGNDVGTADVKAQADMQDGVLLDQLDAEPVKRALLHPEPWLQGENHTAVGIYILMLCRWTRNFNSQPARDPAYLGSYLQRVLARTAVVKAFEAEGLAQPWV